MQITNTAKYRDREVDQPEATFRHKVAAGAHSTPLVQTCLICQQRCEYIGSENTWCTDVFIIQPPMQVSSKDTFIAAACCSTELTTSLFAAVWVQQRFCDGNVCCLQTGRGICILNPQTWRNTNLNDLMNKKWEINALITINLQILHPVPMVHKDKF